jgi:hypothetical protein
MFVKERSWNPSPGFLMITDIASPKDPKNRLVYDQNGKVFGDIPKPAIIQCALAKKVAIGFFNFHQVLELQGEIDIKYNWMKKPEQKSNPQS